MQLQAPVKSIELEGGSAEPVNTIGFKQSLASFINVPSMVIVKDVSDGSVVYIGQEYIGLETYKSIPMKELDADVYDIKVGVYGNGVIERKFYTVINTPPENDGAEREIYSQSFDNDPSLTMTGNARYDAASRALFLDSGGKGGGAEFALENSGMIQGEKICISADINFGSKGISQKYVNYDIIDQNGERLLETKINIYNNSAQSIKINGEEMLLDGRLPDGFAQGVYMRFKSVIDPVGGTLTLTISNLSEGMESTFIGSIPAETTAVSSLSFYDDYNVEGRNAMIDNITVKSVIEEQYGISIRAVDKNGTLIEDAIITVTDKMFGTEIEPARDGRYMMCEGVYGYSVDHNGEIKNGNIDVNSAIESGEVIVRYDTEYTNLLTVEVTQGTEETGEDTTEHSWEFDSNETGDGTDVPVLGGAAYYDEVNGVVSLTDQASGTLDIELSEPLMSGTDSVAVSEFDMYFGRQSGKTTNYRLIDSDGAELVNFNVEEYNSNPDNQKLVVGGEIVASGAELLECISASNTGVNAKATHFKNVIDYATGEISVTISTEGRARTFTGKFSGGEGLEILGFSSSHSYSDKNTCVDNIIFGYEAVPVTNVTFSIEYDGEPVIADITVTSTETGAETEYESDSILLRSGEYRFRAEYNGAVKTGIFAVEEQKEDDGGGAEDPGYEDVDPADGLLMYTDGDMPFELYRYSSASASKVLELSPVSKEKLANAADGDMLTVEYMLTPTDESGGAINSGDQIRFRAGVQLGNRKLYVNGFNTDLWGGWGVSGNAYHMNMNVIDTADPIRVKLTYELEAGGTARCVYVSAVCSDGTPLYEPEENSPLESSEIQKIESVFDPSEFILISEDRGSGKGSTERCFTISELTAVIEKAE